jgi:hypothetical protein
MLRREQHGLDVLVDLRGLREFVGGVRSRPRNSRRHDRHRLDLDADVADCEADAARSGNGREKVASLGYQFANGSLFLALWRSFARFSHACSSVN